MKKSVDVIVVGGGAAGLMCAATVGARGRSVLILERANKLGKKILMSGGGRCNFTNMDISAENYLSSNPHFCKSALKRYTQWDFIELVNKHQVPYHEKTLGQLFCDNKSSDILNLLLRECENVGVRIEVNCDITAVHCHGHGVITTEVDSPDHTDPSAGLNSGFELQTNLGDYSCGSLVIASGGLSIPSLGGSGFGYSLAKQFALPLVSTDPSLVPFAITGKEKSLCEALSGVSLPVEVSCGDTSFSEALLFTHRGLSGPAILQISNYWHAGQSVSINLLPHIDLEQLLREEKQANNKRELKNLLSSHLPKRFVSLWLDEALQQKVVNQLSKQDIASVAELCHQWQVIPSGTEGYRTAEVTRGGVSTDAVSSKTFECKTVPGLYFIGEVLDVTGWLGGYNFQWAWSSGFCAGSYA